MWKAEACNSWCLLHFLLACSEQVLMSRCPYPVAEPYSLPIPSYHIPVLLGRKMFHLNFTHLQGCPSTYFVSQNSLQLDVSLTLTFVTGMQTEWPCATFGSYFYEDVTFRCLFLLSLECANDQSSCPSLIGFCMWKMQGTHCQHHPGMPCGRTAWCLQLSENIQHTSWERNAF